MHLRLEFMFFVRSLSLLRITLSPAVPCRNYQGLARAKAEYNCHADVVNGEQPPFEYAMIVCAMRYFTPEYSRYYASFCEVHKYEDKNRLYGLASMALVTVEWREREREREDELGSL